MLIRGDDYVLPEQLEKQFQPAIETALEKKIRIAHETKEDKIERLMNELGIEKHGKGIRKRKKNKKKKGGRK